MVAHTPFRPAESGLAALKRTPVVSTNSYMSTDELIDMPYRNIDDLPPRVKNHLPTHAQHIFLEAFDHAWNEYADPSKRNDSHADREQTCFRVAWSAVKQEYHKEGDRWVANDEQTARKDDREGREH